ncbi:MAG: hypothetical protein WAO71_03590 [Gallionella sp.]
MSYAIPTNELTLSEITRYKTDALNAGIARAKSKGIAAVDEELVWREALPAFDMGALVLAGSGWALNYYVTPAAAGAGAWASAFGLAAALDPILPVGRIAVFYKVYNPTPGAQATAVRFLLAQATTKAVFFTQSILDSKDEPEAWFSQPVVYDPQDTVNIDFYARAATAGVGEELGFGCFIIERVGAVVS